MIWDCVLQMGNGNSTLLPGSLATIYTDIVNVSIYTVKSLMINMCVPEITERILFPITKEKAESILDARIAGKNLLLIL